MLYTEDFSMRHCVGFSQIGSHISTAKNWYGQNRTSRTGRSGFDYLQLFCSVVLLSQGLQTWLKCLIWLLNFQLKLLL